MRARGLVVHIGRLHLAVVVADFERAEEVLLATDVDLRCIFDIDALVLRLAQLEVHVHGFDQVVHLLTLNFHERKQDLEVLGLVGFQNAGQQSFDHARHHSLHFFVVDVGAGHGMCFTRPCLALSEHGAVLAIEAVFHDWLSYELVEFGLRYGLIEHSIKKLLFLVVVACSHRYELVIRFTRLNTYFISRFY